MNKISDYEKNIFILILRGIILSIAFYLILSEINISFSLYTISLAIFFLSLIRSTYLLLRLTLFPFIILLFMYVNIFKVSI